MKHEASRKCITHFTVTSPLQRQQVTHLIFDGTASSMTQPCLPFMEVTSRDDKPFDNTARRVHTCIPCMGLQREAHPFAAAAVAASRLVPVYSSTPLLHSSGTALASHSR
jgi:hypothetical protein